MVVNGARKCPSPSGKVLLEVSRSDVSWIGHQNLDVYGFNLLIIYLRLVQYTLLLGSSCALVVLASWRFLLV